MTGNLKNIDMHYMRYIDIAHGERIETLAILIGIHNGYNYKEQSSLRELATYHEN